MSLYYECHVTVEPLADDWLKTFKEVANHNGFRVAELYMKKAPGEFVPSEVDTFATSRDGDYARLHDRMNVFVNALMEAKIIVWRFKIEDTILDIRLPH